MQNIGNACGPFDRGQSVDEVSQRLMGRLPHAVHEKVRMLHMSDEF